MAIEMPDFRKYLLEFRSVLTSHGLSTAEFPFNEILGINGLSISKSSYEVYASFGNIFARMLGIGGCSDAVALLNLNALLLYAWELTTLNCYLSVNTPLGCLANIKNIHVLVQEIAKTSVLLDGYAHWYNGFNFMDALHPSKTKSNYIISHLIGAKDLIALVSGAVDCLVKSLYGADGGELLVDMLFAVALNNNLEYVGLSVLYNKPTQCCFESDWKKPVVKNIFDSGNRPVFSVYDFENVKSDVTEI